MVPIERIRNAAELVAIFGYWPTFHDAEVIWLHLDRRPHEEGTPTLESLVHVFEMTEEVDPDGYFVLRDHVLVRFRFRGVVELQLSGFGDQNVLQGLEITDIRNWQWEAIDFDVRFVASYGVAAAFQCRTIEVVSVTPGTDPIEVTHA